MTTAQEPVAPRPRKPRYRAAVVRATQLTPRMKRIVFGGSELGAFQWNGPAAHIKLILGADTPEVRAPSRTYTPRHFSAERGELTVDFVLHGEGPASTWAQGAKVGDSLLIAGPGRCYTLEPGISWIVLAGDESAIPAIATIVEALPRDVHAQVLLEVNAPADEFEITPARTDVPVTWLHRTRPVSAHDPGARAGIELMAAVRDLSLPGGVGRIYIACEADAMRTLRRHLITERALARETLVTRGYWKQGATDHPDRDYGDDVV